MKPIKSLEITKQPDDVTCGPTCLHAVYRYYGDTISLNRVIKEVSYLKTGGTLGALLGCHALDRGYEAKMFTFNLNIFDPTWFALPTAELLDKLDQQLKYKTDRKHRATTEAYRSFIEKGGRILSGNLNFALIKKYITKGKPIVTGLSATYLYGTSREYTNANRKTVYDDIRGYPAGHFVILWGYNKETLRVDIADPFKNNPRAGHSHYSVSADTLINAIMLGILTYDANLLIIEPKRENHA